MLSLARVARPRGAVSAAGACGVQADSARRLAGDVWVAGPWVSSVRSASGRRRGGSGGGVHVGFGPGGESLSQDNESWRSG